MKTPITYYGGKQSMLKYILPIIPTHNLYCEPFFGGGAVFFAKEPSKVEVINDLNAEVVNFYRMLKTNFVELQLLVSGTMYSRHEHVKAKVIYDHPYLFDEVRRAWAFWVLTNTGFAGQISDSWGYSVQKSACSLKLYNKKENFQTAFAQRLNLVQVECDDAIKVIKRFDRKDTFHYVDPPYFNSNLGHYGGYTAYHFEELLKTLGDVEGKFLMSSYDSDLLQKYIKKNKWHSYKIVMNLSAAKEKKGAKKVEVLTANFPIKEVLDSIVKK